MATIEIDDDLARKLGELAARRGQTMDDVLRGMLKQTEQLEVTEEQAEAGVELLNGIAHKDEAEVDAALNAFIGMFDDDVTDLSTTVRETMAAYYRKKYGDSA